MPITFPVIEEIHINSFVDLVSSFSLSDAEMGRRLDIEWTIFHESVSDLGHSENYRREQQTETAAIAVIWSDEPPHIRIAFRLAPEDTERLVESITNEGRIYLLHQQAVIVVTERQVFTYRRSDS